MVTKNDPIFYLIVFSLLQFPTYFCAFNAKEMGEALDRAIEKTKLHQSADRDTHDTKMARTTQTKNSLPLRMEGLDVEKLNLLLRTIDKAWAMPKLGFSEAVGSNFQVRFNACSSPGFGIMCFNFCYEHGEKLVYECTDSSDFNFCKSNSNYDQLLTKYKRDPYRAKADYYQKDVSSESDVLRRIPESLKIVTPKKLLHRTTTTPATTTTSFDIYSEEEYDGIDASKEVTQNYNEDVYEQEEKDIEEIRIPKRKDVEVSKKRSRKQKPIKSAFAKKPKETIEVQYGSRTAQQPIGFWKVSINPLFGNAKAYNFVNPLNLDKHRLTRDDLMNFQFQINKNYGP